MHQPRFARGISATGKWIIPLLLLLLLLLGLGSLYLGFYRDPEPPPSFEPHISVEPPASFYLAKNALREIYDDRAITFYCECDIEWTSGSAGRADLVSCGYDVRRNEQRASRIEWEHVVPASEFGRDLACWNDGGRSNCTSTDARFKLIEADMHNLVPAVGEVNGDRSNYAFGLLPESPDQYGQCDFLVDFRQQLAEPPEAVRGQIARIYFYMSDRYELTLSSAQQTLYREWDRAYPVTAEELELNAEITRYMGHPNPFVTEEKAYPE